MRKIWPQHFQAQSILLVTFIHHVADIVNDAHIARVKVMHKAGAGAGAWHDVVHVHLHQRPHPILFGQRLHIAIHANGLIAQL